MRNNIRLVLSDKKYIIIYMITLLCFSIPGFIFFNYRLSLGNLGVGPTYIEIIMHIIVSILFALFFTGQIYKLKVIGASKHNSKPEGIIGGILGIFLIGCPSCGIGVISYLGLTGFLSRVPTFGPILKAIALILLTRANYNIYKNLLSCKIK